MGETCGHEGEVLVDMVWVNMGRWDGGLTFNWFVAHGLESLLQIRGFSFIDNLTSRL